jgi:hypothetical protein
MCVCNGIERYDWEVGEYAKSVPTSIGRSRPPGGPRTVVLVGVWWTSQPIACSSVQNRASPCSEALPMFETVTVPPVLESDHISVYLKLECNVQTSSERLTKRIPRIVHGYQVRVGTKSHR